MSTIDIRDESPKAVTCIVFADAMDDSFILATHLTCSINDDGLIQIYDEEDDFVSITSKEHAENLIKALNKAIELKWVV